MKIRGFRIELGEIEAALGRAPGGAARRWCCCAQDGRRRPAASGLRRGRGRGLAGCRRASLGAPARGCPRYMVPAAFVFLDRPAADAERQGRSARAPGRPWQCRHRRSARTPPEERLKERSPRSGPRCWASSGSAPQDNFFELGGDSILAIQVVAREPPGGLLANAARRSSSTRPSRELAAARGRGRRPRRTRGCGPAAAADADPALVLRTRSSPHPEHFNQALLLLDPAGARAGALLAGACGALLAPPRRAPRALRTARPRRWTQRAAPAGGRAAVRTGRPVGAAASRRAAAAITPAGDRGCRPASTSPPGRSAAWPLRPGPRGPARLLLVVHHLAVDGVSWRILLEDLEAAYGQLAARRGRRAAGQDDLLPSMVRAVDRACASRADSTRHGPAGPRRLPTRSSCRLIPRRDRQRALGAHRVVVARSRRDRGAAARLPQATGRRADEALLAALARALERWAGPGPLDRRRGPRPGGSVRGSDLSRTVGWFTSRCPSSASTASPPGAPPGAPRGRRAARSDAGEELGWPTARCATWTSGLRGPPGSLPCRGRP